MAASKDGARYMILAVIFFALAHASVKSMGHFSFYQLVFLRQVVALFICALMMARKGISPWGRNKVLLGVRGFVGTIALACYFYALQHMPLASAVTLQFLSPIFTLVFAHWFLNEPSQPKTWFYFLLAFVGVLIVKGFDPRISDSDVVISMIGVVASAAAYTSVRALKSHDHELVIVFYFPLVTIPLMGPFAYFHWQWPLWWEWGVILVIGLFTFLAQLFMTMAYQRDKAEDIGIYNYLGLLIALVIGYAFFDETFGVLSFAGMGLILVAVFMATENKPRVFQSFLKK